jgi:hypothetical protein
MGSSRSARADIQYILLGLDGAVGVHDAAGVLAALGASACCSGPLILLLLGVWGGHRFAHGARRRVFLGCCAVACWIDNVSRPVDADSELTQAPRFRCPIIAALKTLPVLRYNRFKTGQSYVGT